MITKELAVTLQPGRELWHIRLKNANGTPLRARVNGRCKTWKTKPQVWKLPVKHGLKDCFYIGCSSDDGRVAWVSGGYPHDWCLPERWEIEKFYRP